MLSPQDQQTTRQIAKLLTNCHRVLFITGAGISVDSGLPTYRGIGGLYGDMATGEGYAIEEILSGDMFKIRPELTWKYIAQLEATCRGARYNPAHKIIAEARHLFKTALVLTQNIDGFHHDAGSADIIDIHGNLRDLICTQCDWTEHVTDYRHLSIPPYCPDCAAIIRPDVVLFGELLPETKYHRLISEVETGFDAVFSIGTSSLFPYISYPVWHARQAGAITIEINPDMTEVSRIVDYKINAGASDALTAIFAH